MCPCQRSSIIWRWPRWGRTAGIPTNGHSRPMRSSLRWRVNGRRPGPHAHDARSRSADRRSGWRLQVHEIILEVVFGARYWDIDPTIKLRNSLPATSSRPPEAATTGRPAGGTARSDTHRRQVDVRRARRHRRIGVGSDFAWRRHGRTDRLAHQRAFLDAVWLRILDVDFEDRGTTAWRTWTCAGRPRDRSAWTFELPAPPTARTEPQVVRAGGDFALAPRATA